MAEDIKRVRSPKFPFVDLGTAIQRADTFYQSEKRNSASISVAAEKWGYNDKSSGGLQTISALKEFGLMEDFGNKDARRVKLTDRALRIILDKREGSVERLQLIKEAALLPKIHSFLWEQYHGELPSDSNLRHYLMFDYETRFNENSVDDFIAQFRATLALAKLTASDNISPDDEDKKLSKDESEHEPPRVGDFVQWESQGILQFPEPKRVREISEDGEWAFVEGSNTGVLMAQLTVVDPPTNPPPAPPPGSPPAPRVVVDERARQTPPPPPGLRQDVFSLSEGPVTIQWPAALSPDSFEDLAAWLDILKRKIGRSVESKHRTGVSLNPKDQVHEE